MPNIYQGTQSKFVFPIDLQTWLDEGWTTSRSQASRASNREETPQMSTFVDLNQATESDLVELKIGVANAKKLIEARPFADLDAAVALVPKLKQIDGLYVSQSLTP